MANALTDTGNGGQEEMHDISSVESNSEATAEQDTGTEETGQADDNGEETPEAPKKVPWFQKRIDEVTAKKYEAEREAAYWRGIAEGRTPKAEPQPEIAQTPPDMFEDPQGYSQWLISQAKEEARKDLQREQNARTYEARVAAFKADKPDFDSVAFDPTLPVSPNMAQVIFESDKGPEVLYWLGQNRQEAARISALPHHLQAKELGRIEASIGMNTAAVTPQPKRNPPPPPPNTVSGLSAGTQKSPDDMTMAEYVAARKAGNI